MKKQTLSTIKKTSGKPFFLGLIYFMFCCFTTVTAQRHCWTAVGSDGTVDEADLGVVALSSNTAAVRSGTIAATVDIRYNIVATEGLFGGECSAKTLLVRFADNGSSARVVVRLHTFNIRTGVSSILAELNSYNFPPSNVAHAESVSFTGEFNFETNIYYIEVHLIKTGINGNPLIRGLQICGVTIC
ncbi:MAG TPA: hypothetical protein VJU78_14915 [Chitinophagaceae bacterium]|nr:hypothetical protein [Chitinophagaceae bacterium]